MDQFFWLILQLLDTVTGGALSRGGRCDGGYPDPAEVWDEEERRRERVRHEAESMIGRTGTVATPLRPTGRIQVDRRLYEAITDGNFVEAGNRIEVVGRNGFGLIVRERSE